MQTRGPEGKGFESSLDIISADLGTMVEKLLPPKDSNERSSLHVARITDGEVDAIESYDKGYGFVDVTLELWRPRQPARSEHLHHHENLDTADPEGTPWLSPDGSTLVFSRTQNGNDDLWIARRAPIAGN